MIDIAVWQTLVILGLATTAIWAVLGRSVAPMMLSSLAVWSVLALRSGTIRVGYGQGPATGAYPSLQLLFAFLALATTLSLVAYVFDLWAPADDSEVVDDAVEDPDPDDPMRDGPRMPLRED